MTSLFIGIDVQVSRGCAYSVLDGQARQIDRGWIPADSGLEPKLDDLVGRFPDRAFGIDAPRAARLSPRDWYWSRNGWRPRTPADRGHGRHCEVIVAAHRLARPQWTPLAGQSPPWMEIGFRIFRHLSACCPVFEVFPSASYALLEHDDSLRVTLSFRGFRDGVKDMLDATIAALSVREFVEGRGIEVGGGDGLGTLVLPRPIPQLIPDVLIWPG